MCIKCGSANTHSDNLCYGCILRAKNLNIQGETVAGHTFGEPYYKILTDTPQDQGVVAGKEWVKISKEMRSGGAVAEDKLQQPCDTQRIRARDAALAVGCTGTIPEMLRD